jgi:hypothetical protein
MKCEPVPFQTQHRQMLYQLKFMLEKKHILIHPKRFQKLVTTLRTAVAREGVLDKEATSYDDILDAMRLCVRGFEIEQNDRPIGTGTWTDDQVASIQEQRQGKEQREKENSIQKWISYKSMAVGY